MFRLVGRRAALAWMAAAIAAVPTLVRGVRSADAKPATPAGPASHARPASHPQPEAHAKPASQKAFRLVTGCGAQAGCSCKACKAHAANKLFASRADVVRAHRGCNCQVEPEALPRDIWIALFGLPERPTTTAVDKRDPRVQQVLSHLPEGHGHRTPHRR